MKKLLIILIFAAAASMMCSARAEYTEDDGIVFKGQWFKRYVLVPQDYTVEDGKRIIVENDDMILRVNRDGMITKLIFDVHNNTKQTIKFPIRRAYLRIGDKVYPFKSRGEAANDDVWEVGKMKKKKKFERRYVETAQAVPFNIEAPTNGEIVIPYRIGNEAKTIEIKMVVAPCAKGNDDEED